MTALRQTPLFVPVSGATTLGFTPAVIGAGGEPFAVNRILGFTEAEIDVSGDFQIRSETVVPFDAAVAQVVGRAFTVSSHPRLKFDPAVIQTTGDFNLNAGRRLAFDPASVNQTGDFVINFRRYVNFDPAAVNWTGQEFVPVGQQFVRIDPAIVAWETRDYGDISKGASDMPQEAERRFVTAEATGNGQGTGELVLDQLERSSVSIGGTFAGTIELQRQLDGTNWRTVKEYTAPAEETYEADERCGLRLTMTAFTSGTAELRLGKG